MVVRQYSVTGHREGARLEEPRIVETILSRYRNLIILAMVVVAQLLLLAWQVRTNQDVRLIRVWAVTAVTPMAGVIEAVRRNTIGFLEDYFILLDVREQNRKLRAENSRLKMDNVYYRNQLQTADRARILSVFQEQTPSKTVAARIIGNTTASSAQAVFIDRGSTSGIEDGMAVVTPDGIVGKVVAVYPLAAQVLLVTDPTFAVGVESQKGHIHGTLQCNGSNCTVDFIQNEEKVAQGEWFYTSGEDRIFPKGFPVGTVSSIKPGQFMKEIHLGLSGSPGAADEVLVILEGVHQQIPTTPPEQHMAKALPPPPPENASTDQQAPKLSTEADSIKQKYLEVGKAQNHEFGAVGSNIPNFNQNQASPPAAPTGQAVPGPAASAPKTPAAGPAAASKPQAPAPPPQPSGSILGARPQTHSTPPPRKPAAEQTPAGGPPLPLGAPRKKPVPSEPSVPPQ
ncbi:MAG: rod shape-determining protein MreC [Bryobacteraceae bacterium]